MPKINVRSKGQSGEREIATLLNAIVLDVRKQLRLPLLDERDYPFQRNQNQSAVGGDDLANPFGLAIEVKRQEQLSVNTWWQQCVASAARSGGMPILIYRQNRKQWRVRTLGVIEVPTGSRVAVGTCVEMCVEISIDDLETWFYEYCKHKLAE